GAYPPVSRAKVDPNTWEREPMPDITTEPGVAPVETGEPALQTAYSIPGGAPAQTPPQQPNFDLTPDRHAVARKVMEELGITEEVSPGQANQAAAPANSAASHPPATSGADQPSSLQSRQDTPPDPFANLDPVEQQYLRMRAHSDPQVRAEGERGLSQFYQQRMQATAPPQPPEPVKVLTRE